MMKYIKFVLGLLLGFIFGFVGVIAAITFFSDMSLSTFIEKLLSIDLLSMGGIILGSIASFVVSLFLQTILHEAGHLVCGLATGYTFVSFRIGSLTLVKKQGRFFIKRYSIAGTGGQCLLAPPQKPLNEIHTTWYNLGGVFANLLGSVLVLIPILFMSGIPTLIYTFLVMFCLIGVSFALMNGIPMKVGGIGNDAYNMRMLLKNTESKQALMTQLRVNALMQEGVRLKDMPAEWFSDEEVPDYKDALQTTICLMTASRYEDMGDMDKAYAIFNNCFLHKDEIIGLLVKEIKCELLLIALIKGYTERVDELYSNDINTYINQYKKVMSSKQVLLCALALYREQDIAKAKQIYHSVCQQREKYLMQGEVEMSIALMRFMLGNEL